MGSDFPFAAEPQAGAAVDARRNVYLELPLLANLAPAAASPTGIVNDATLAAAAGARPADGEESLLVMNLASTAALTAGPSLSASRRACAVAVVARL